eukprot:766645-Hanusia_phi.AAC.2
MTQKWLRQEADHEASLPKFQSARERVKGQTLAGLTKWRAEVLVRMKKLERKTGSHENERDLLFKRIKWCSGAIRWIKNCPDFAFNDRLPHAHDGQDLNKCVLFINNELFDEARILLLKGQEIIGRWKKQAAEQAIALNSSKKDVGFEDEDGTEPDYCCFFSMNCNKMSSLTKDGSFVGKVFARNSNSKEIVERVLKNVAQAEEHLRLVSLYLRIQESLWVRHICERLDNEREAEAMAMKEYSDGMVEEQHEEEQEDFDPVQISVNNFNDVADDLMNVEEGERDGEGIIDTGEIQEGFLRQSWLQYFMARGSTSFKSLLYDWILLPGWRRSFPGGPARLFEWIEREQEWSQVAAEERTQRTASLLAAARTYYMKRKELSKFPMPLEELVIRLQEIRLKEAVLLLGKQLQYQGKIAVPPCRWMTQDELLERKTKMKIKAVKVSANASQKFEFVEEEEDVDEDDLINVEKVAVHQAGFIFQAYKVTSSRRSRYV